MCFCWNWILDNCFRKLCNLCGGKAAIPPPPPKSKFGEQLSIWFVLNHLLDPHDPEAIRQWASYLKTHPTIPGGELHQLVSDKQKLHKILLSAK